MFQTNFFLNNSLDKNDSLNLNDDDLFSLGGNLNYEFFNESENYFMDYSYGNNTINPNFEEQPKLINKTNKTTAFKSVEKNKLLGRKRKNSESKGKHTKYDLDNRVRKVKVLFKNALLEFINSKMKNIQVIVEIKGKKYIASELLNIRPKLIEDININANKTLLVTPIKNILSDNISGAYKNYPKDYNKIVIEKIFENEDNKILKNILNMTFLECLKYYRKNEEIINNDKYDCLKGLEKKYENLPNLLKKGVNDSDEEYEKGILNLIDNFDKIYFKKTPRTKKE
jgi:hypothetical protein